MALVVHALGAYATYGDHQWRDDDYCVLQFIKSLKGKTFNGYAQIYDINGKLRRVDAPDSPVAFEIFGMWAADVLKKMNKGQITIVPVPSSKHTDFDADFVPLRLARAAEKFAGGSVSVRPVLAFKEPMESSHAGGTRHQETIYANLKSSAQRLTGHVVLLDDVKTTGAHLRACAAFLRQRGATIDSAICAASTATSPVVNPFKLGPEDLEGVLWDGD